MDQSGFIKHVIDPKTGEAAPPDGVLTSEDIQMGMHGELEGRDDLSGGGSVVDRDGLPRAGSWAKAEAAAPKKAAPAKAAAADKS